MGMIERMGIIGNRHGCETRGKLLTNLFINVYRGVLADTPTMADNQVRRVESQLAQEKARTLCRDSLGLK